MKFHLDITLFTYCTAGTIFWKQKKLYFIINICVKIVNIYDSIEINHVSCI